MVKVDLITGLLGAGKTTFLKQYAAYWLEQGLKIAILVNDHGAVNVDAMLLQELPTQCCNVETVTGGGDWACHQRRLKTKLISMAMLGYDRVLLEPSGVFDVEEFFDILREEPLDRWYQIGNVIAVADIGMDELSEDGEYLLAVQTACAGMIVLSHTDVFGQERAEKTIDRIAAAIEKFNVGKLIDYTVLRERTAVMNRAALVSAAQCGYRRVSLEKRHLREQDGYGTLYYMNLSLSRGELRKRADILFREGSCGKVLRIKGFLAEKDGWTQINATREAVEMQTVSQGQAVIIVIGEGMNRQQVDKIINKKNDDAI